MNSCCVKKTFCVRMFRVTRGSSSVASFSADAPNTNRISTLPQTRRSSDILGDHTRSSSTSSLPIKSAIERMFPDSPSAVSRVEPKLEVPLRIADFTNSTKNAIPEVAASSLSHQKEAYSFDLHRFMSDYMDFESQQKEQSISRLAQTWYDPLGNKAKPINSSGGFLDAILDTPPKKAGYTKSGGFVLPKKSPALKKSIDTTPKTIPSSSAAPSARRPDPSPKLPQTLNAKPSTARLATASSSHGRSLLSTRTARVEISREFPTAEKLAQEMAKAIGKKPGNCMKIPPRLPKVSLKPALDTGKRRRHSHSFLNDRDDWIGTL